VDRRIVAVPVLVVCEPGRQVCRDKAQLGVGKVEPNRHRSLVARDARHARLLHAALDVLDLRQDRLAHKNAQGSPDQLPAAEQDILLAVYSLCVRVQTPSNCLLPQLLPRRVAVHDLLGTQLDNLLETNNVNLWLRVAENIGK